MIICPNCKKESSLEAKFCSNCGTILPQLSSYHSGDIVAVGGSSVIRASNVYLNDSLNAPKLYECPLCGKINIPNETFRCKKCQKTFICLKHQDPQFSVCSDCVSQKLFFSGNFYNNSSAMSGLVIIELIISKDVVSGFIDFSGAIGALPLCGAGKFTGTKNGASITFRFLSKDPKPGCETMSGYFISIDATISDPLAVINGKYTIEMPTPQHGTFQALRR